LELRQGKIKERVLARITEEGPLQSKDFADKHHSSGQWWDWKPPKLALELLFLQGKLMITHRTGFQKVFDLTERVLPAHIDTPLPTPFEYARYLVLRYIQTNGIGNQAEFGYLRKNMRQTIKTTVLQMLETGEICQITVANNSYYTTTQKLAVLDKKWPKRAVRILSPFDNLATLFDYDYQLECYVKEQNRKFGYFCLPLLWGDDFVGRLDAKAVRHDKILIIYNLVIEKNIDDVVQFAKALASALDSYARFNQCDQWQIQQCNHSCVLEQVLNVRSLNCKSSESML
jgi:uncharacterized protein YcaQ